MTRFRDLFPTTPSERIAMTLAYLLVAIGWWMVTEPYKAGALITRVAVAAWEVVS